MLANDEMTIGSRRFDFEIGSRNIEQIRWRYIKNAEQLRLFGAF